MCDSMVEISRNDDDMQDGVAITHSENSSAWAFVDEFADGLGISHASGPSADHTVTHFVWPDITTDDVGALVHMLESEGYEVRQGAEG